MTLLGLSLLLVLIVSCSGAVKARRALRRRHQKS